MEMLNRLDDYDRKLFSKVCRQSKSRLTGILAGALSRSGVERGLHWSLKNSLKRPRPQNAIPGLHSLGKASNQFSFPSGHSSRAFLLATTLVVVYGIPALVMYPWAAAVALSRVVLGVHYPGDALAGALTGSGVALFGATLLGLL